MELPVKILELKSGAKIGTEEVGEELRVFEVELMELELKLKVKLKEQTMLLLKMMTLLDYMRFSIMLH